LELLFLDENLEVISAPVDDFVSFTWAERWYESGNFQLYLPSYRFGAVRYARYIYNQDKDECAKITSRNYDESTAKDNLVVGGRMLGHLLNQRVINTEKIINDTLENAVYSLMTQFALTGDRLIPELELAPQRGYDDLYNGTIKAGTQLDKALYDMLKPYGMTYRIRYDFYNKTLIFSVEKGLDRTQEQEENTWAIFSDNFENLINTSYNDSVDDYRNFAYVADGNNVITVDLTGGGERYELYISGKTYQDGVEALAQYPYIETARGDIDTQGNLAYGVDYSIGDKCDIVMTKLNLVMSSQITAVDHVCETAGIRVIPQFGEEKLNIRAYIERELK